MKISAKLGKWSAKDSEALIVPIGEKEAVPKGLPKLGEQLLKDAINAKTFIGKKNQAISFALPKLGGSALRHIYFIGIGKAKDLKISEFGELLGASVRKAQSAKQLRLGFWFRDSLAIGLGEAEHVAQAIAEYAGLAGYEYNAFLKEKKPQVKSLEVVVENKAEWTAIRQGIQAGNVIYRAINESREISNHPSNEVTPKYFANFVKEEGAKSADLKVKVIGEKEMAKLGMGAILGVSRGSDEEAQFVIVEYWGAGKLDTSKKDAGKVINKKAPYVFVGKGVTFDTGGISIKPSPSMHEMKFDMCGAAAALAIVRSVAALKLKVNVVSLIPLAENMPGSKAQKPGDIVRAMDGSTIEVLNTDAEGRLLLADVLVYARQYKPKAVIDLATLTGSVVAALGDFGAGLFSKEDKFAQELFEAAEFSGDLAWQLPLPDRAKDHMKSDVADIANISNIRYAGATTAAAFLNHFVAGKYRWAHIDIAGVAWASKGYKHMAPGSTGAGVRMCLEWLRNQL